MGLSHIQVPLHHVSRRFTLSELIPRLNGPWWPSEIRLEEKDKKKKYEKNKTRMSRRMRRKEE
jgi:hypothetical protein